MTTEKERASDRYDSIFVEYYKDHPFVDRFAQNPDGAIDVLIPVIHTNELWEANLKSIYREVPVNALLIGDGGCIDDSIEIARKFPRVKVFNHRSYKSLGYSVRRLIEAVETEWFSYIHSDVYLPPGWFDTMRSHQHEYEWFGCRARHTVMVDYEMDFDTRPWAGSQMGRKSSFLPALSRIDDDYVYRQEDFIFSDVVARSGGREGKVPETVHYHQTMRKPSPWSRDVKSVDINMDVSREEEVRALVTQARGAVKYLQPNDHLVIRTGVDNAATLVALGETTWEEFRQWVAETNPAWLPYLPSRATRAYRRFRSAAGRLVRAAARLGPR